MHKRFTFFLDLFLFLGLASLFLPTPSQAQVVKAVVYPDTAQLTEMIQKEINDGRFFFTLPFQADPQSLSLKLITPNIQVADITTLLAPAEPNQAVKELKHQIRLKQMEFNKTSALVSAQNAQMEFWKSIRMDQEPTAQTAKHVAAQMGASLSEVMEQALVAQETYQTVEKELNDLKHRLDEFSGQKAQVWLVTVAVDGNATGQITARISYRLKGCGWEPVYRVDATPDKKKVALVFDAMVWQSTGKVWNAPLSLATLPPHQQMTPPTLPAWIITPRPDEKTYQDAAPRMAMMKEAEPMLEKSNLVAGGGPVKQRQSTFASWDLGERKIMPGPKQRVRIADVDMQSDFTYLLRPSLSGKSFLSANVETAEPLDMPSGTALIMLDGAVVAQKPFTFQGKKQELFFGNDPQVTVMSRILEKKSGSSGMFSSKQTYVWKWEITVTNDKTLPAKITLEEPMPRPGDEKITLKSAFSTPPTREEDDKYVWDMDIPAGSKQIITWSVSLEAPDDMSLNKGWR